VKNRTRKWFLRPVFLGIVGVVLIMLAGIFLYRQLARIPPVVAQVRNMQDTFVVIHAPKDQSHWPADAAIPVTVAIHAYEPVASLELYAGDSLVATQQKTYNMVGLSF